MKELFTAMALAKADFPPIVKNSEVEVKSKEGKFLYSFKYADLTEIITKVTPSLSKHGISFTQTVKFDEHMKTVVTTTLIHASGNTLETGLVPISLSLGLAMKEVAGAITYAKRISLSLALGISADDDMDAPHEKGETVKPKPAAPKAPVGTQGTTGTTKSEKKVESAKPGMISFATASKLKQRALTNKWTMAQIQDCVTQVTGAKSWDEVTEEQGVQLDKIFQYPAEIWKGAGG